MKRTWLICTWGMLLWGPAPLSQAQGWQLQWASGAAMCSLPPVACGPLCEGVSAFTGCNTG